MTTLLHLILVGAFVFPFARLLYNIRRTRQIWMDLYGVYEKHYHIRYAARHVFQRYAAATARPRRWMRRHGYAELLEYL